MIFTSITYTLMASIAMFSTVMSIEILGKALQTFSLKRSPLQIFLIPNFVIGPHVVQFRE